jgi:hypothetical protein
MVPPLRSIVPVPPAPEVLPGLLSVDTPAEAGSERRTIEERLNRSDAKVRNRGRLYFM